MSSRGTVLAEFERMEAPAIDTCVSCPRLCRWACPVAEAESRESTTPHSLVVLGGLLKRERASTESVGAFPYHCSHCGACTEACRHDNDVPLLVSLTRSRLMKAGAAHSAVKELCGHFGVAGNPQGASLESALEEVVSEADASISRTGETVYFPGCETLSSAPEAATSFLRAVSLLGLPEVSVTDASAFCCGLPLFWAGELEGFRAHAERTAAHLKDVKTLLVHDAGCAQAFAVRYRDIGVELRPEVKHVSQFFAEELRVGDKEAKGRLARKDSGARQEPQKVAFADSCALARGMGVTREPRQLIESLLGHAPIELAGLTGREVDCCGASGLLPLTAPETAAAMAQTRIQAFRRSGADVLLTFSPRCATHLKSVDPQLSVVDVSTLLARL